MQQLDPEEMEAEILSFNMDLERAFQKDGPLYITIHRDVVQSMIDSHTDISGTVLALEERIEELEKDPLISFVTRSKPNPQEEGKTMNDTENNEAETEAESPGVSRPESNDAIELGLNQLRSAIEVGKSISRREVVIDIATAEYVLAVIGIYVAFDADFAEVDEDEADVAAEIGAEIKDLNERVASLEDECAGHMERVAKRDGTILELQEAIINNNQANAVRVEALTRTIDELHKGIGELQEELTEAVAPAETKGKKKK